jgi:tetratricopeptide (TPR) repeat protein
MAEKSNNTIPFEKHPLYQEAMDQIVAGDKEAAVDTLKRLSERYPDEQFLQDLLVRVQLQSTFGNGEYIPVDRSQGTPILRTVVMVMLIITTCLVVAAGLIAFVPGVKGDADSEIERQLQRQEELWDEFEWRKEGGDISGMREVLAQFLTEFPGDKSAEQALEDVDWLKWCSDMYADGVRQTSTQAALDILAQIPPECPNYEQAQERITVLRKQGTKETAWMEAQGLFQAEDWQGAITTLTWIRQQDQDFQQPQVDNLLFEAHTRIARDLLDGARGDVERVRAAASHLKEALSVRPGSQDILDEYRIAVGYVAGYEAYARGDWSIAVERWEPLYAMQPDYQDGALWEKLSESYPLAAEELITESGGSIMRMTQALDYLDRALEIDPANEKLQEEKEFATEYLAGHEAFVQMDFGLAISHWGPLHEVRPEYLDGKLEEDLRSACTQSTVPDEQYCTP